MAENVKVIVRCRPMNKKESDMKCKSIVQIDDCAVHLEHSSDSLAPQKNFTYDSAYDWNASSETLYNDICYTLVENVLQGYNGTIFAYGQTGCGKSHTMQGPSAPVDPSVQQRKAWLAQRGIISRSFDHIFEAISVVSGVRYLALVSYLEIYNENIRDLLNPSMASNCLALKEQPGDGIVVQNLSTHTVHNARDCEHLLAIGTKNRMVGATQMNATSSRSHSIFTISLEQIETTGDDGDGSVKVADCEPAIKKGKLNLVDLAGSERQNKTGATGDRLKEATKINLSLSALGNVISALVDGKTNHVPYRDSKLTRLLQDSLGGNTKTLMVACISPAAYNYDETLSTLRYASRAKNIHNKPKINEDPKEAMLREYQEEIIKLKQLLQTGGGGGGGGIIDEARVIRTDALDIDDEKERLKIKYETDAIQLRGEYDAQLKEKEDLVRDMEKLRQHYEEQLLQLSKAHELNNTNSNNNSETHNRNTMRETEVVASKVAALKGDLIGGERANDVQLKEKHKKKKIAAEKRLSALANAISRIEQSADRDILQGHYTDIRQELHVKTDALKQQRQKVRALDREVSDLQAEFQLDRADYLETIRRLEKNLKFWQQLMHKALPLLRRDGRFWDPDTIRGESEYNDDLGRWKLPDNALVRVKLPPADATVSMNGGATSAPATSATASASVVTQSSQCVLAITTPQLLAGLDVDDGSSDYGHQLQSLDSDKKLERYDGRDIAGSYFRPRRAAVLMHQNRVVNNWKEFTKRSRQRQPTPLTAHFGGSGGGGGNMIGAILPSATWPMNSGGGDGGSDISRVALNRNWGGGGIVRSTSSFLNSPHDDNEDTTVPVQTQRSPRLGSTSQRQNRPHAASSTVRRSGRHHHQAIT